MGRPVIGITAAIEHAAWTVWSEVEADISPRSYSLCVWDSGGLPVILAPPDEGTETPAQTLDLLDGLILTGGADLDPAIYGAERDPRTVGFRRERDVFELALARGALERDLPLLGICRGMQLLNVARGGTLDQHLAELELHLHTPGSFTDHEVVLEPDSLAARAVGTARIEVRSHHHQGIGRLGEGVRVSGRAEPGGLPEAIEVAGRRFVLGVLWHAEEERRSRVIGALTAAAREQAVPA